MVEGGGDCYEAYRKFREALSSPTCASCMGKAGVHHGEVGRSGVERNMEVSARSAHIDCFMCNEKWPLHSLQVIKRLAIDDPHSLSRTLSQCVDLERSPQTEGLYMRPY